MQFNMEQKKLIWIIYFKNTFNKFENRGIVDK